MVVEGPTGVESEIGSFQLTNEQRRWIWEHRDVLTGQIAEVRALTVNESGAIRVFVRFHPSKSEQGLLLYSESLVGSTDPDESRPMMFRLKSSAGWRRYAESKSEPPHAPGASITPSDSPEERGFEAPESFERLESVSFHLETE